MLPGVVAKLVMVSTRPTFPAPAKRNWVPLLSHSETTVSRPPTGVTLRLSELVPAGAVRVKKS